MADTIDGTVKQWVAEHLGDAAGEMQVCRRPGDIQLVYGQDTGVEIVAVNMQRHIGAEVPEVDLLPFEV